jgi:hypothetical protein
MEGHVVKHGFLVSVVALLVAFVPSPGEACSCLWAGPFLSVAPRVESIVRARVVGYSGNAMDVEVLEVLKGAERPGRMRIRGDNGIQCRPYVTQFPRGTEWIFAIDRNTEEQERGGFAISACGEYWARVEGDTVIGQLSRTRRSAADVPERMSLSEVRARLRR